MIAFLNTFLRTHIIDFSKINLKTSIKIFKKLKEKINICISLALIPTIKYCPSCGNNMKLNCNNKTILTYRGRCIKSCGK